MEQHRFGTLPGSRSCPNLGNKSFDSPSMVTLAMLLPASPSIWRRLFIRLFRWKIKSRYWISDAYRSNQTFISTRRKEIAVGCVLLALASATLYLCWLLGFSFAFEIARRAMDLSVHSTFATSYSRVLIDIAVGIYVLKKIHSRDGGLSAVLKHWKRNLEDAFIAMALAAVITFLYHSFVTVRQEIWAEAAKAKPPIFAFPTPPKPPKFAYQRSLPASASHAGKIAKMEKRVDAIEEIVNKSGLESALKSVALANMLNRDYPIRWELFTVSFNNPGLIRRESGPLPSRDPISQSLEFDWPMSCELKPEPDGRISLILPEVILPPDIMLGNKIVLLAQEGVSITMHVNPEHPLWALFRGNILKSDRPGAEQYDFKEGFKPIFSITVVILATDQGGITMILGVKHYAEAAR